MKNCILPLTIALILTGCATQEKAFWTSKDTMPPMGSRPVNLIPGDIPEGVRYRFNNNQSVIDTANILNESLLSGVEVFSDDGVLVFPGAWNWFKSYSDIGRDNFTKATHVSRINGSSTARIGVVLKDSEEIERLSLYLAKMLEDDGGFIIGSMSSKEMSEWWPYIPLDISEPTFVIKSRNGKFRFVVVASLEDGIITVDELNKIEDL